MFLHTLGCRIETAASSTLLKGLESKDHISATDYLLNTFSCRHNSAAELSLFAESAAAVNRVVLQHMSRLVVPDARTDVTIGLSPPAESRLLQRRRSSALQNAVENCEAAVLVQPTMG